MTSPAFTPEDRAFLRAILDHPADRMPWMAYADWLDDRGDPRSEFLRLSVERADLPEGDPHRYGIDIQLAALRAELDANWMMMFDTPLIGNCRQPPWEFRCPRNWDQLATTDTPDIRFCCSCRRPVFFAHTVEEAQQFASSGECVAISTRAWPETSTPFDLVETIEMGLLMPEDDEWEVPEPPPPPPEPTRRPWWKVW
jgi:uncharacterized protein (TIGR02996 family)